jgi:outer membrane murein-binding lipoprotein Lpp
MSRAVHWIVLAGLAGVVLVAWTAVAEGVQPIPWNADRPLTWADFQGVPDADASPNIGARTHILLNYRYQYITEFDRSTNRYCARVHPAGVQVDCMVDPLTSWVRPDARSDRLLNHEQRHFDLAQVYARKIRTAISTLAAYGASSEAAKSALTTQVQSVASQIAQRWHETDSLYDQETGGGIDPNAQQQWNQRIDSWLANPAIAP